MMPLPMRRITVRSGAESFGVKMIAYVGALRETEVEVFPEDLGCGAGKVPCFECLGSGWWAFMEPEIPGEPCVCCKGTGYVLISI